MEKLEYFFNKLIFKIFEMISQRIPVKIKNSFNNKKTNVLNSFHKLKTIPILLRKIVDQIISSLKDKKKHLQTLSSLPLKIKTIWKDIQSSSPKKVWVPYFALKYLLLFIFKDSNIHQRFILFIFSIASVISILLIEKSGKNILKNHSLSRMPASTEEETTYDRPDYYKMDQRLVEITGLRFPVFFANVNELKSVDIDFMITTSNRYCRSFIYKNDLLLRDHLLSRLEPILPTFPLEEEGKIIIKKKLLDETNDFLRINKIEGEVLKVDITYILAN